MEKAPGEQGEMDVMAEYQKGKDAVESDRDIQLAQQLTLSLLKKYKEICESNSLHYFLVGGALIGAYRHNGFIPWDDDVDVVMPRPDYERFITIAETKCGDGYGICNRHTDKEWHFAMSQFVDLESEVEINLAKNPRRAHVWIDVFPLDGSPNNKLLRLLHIKHVMLLRYLIQIANIYTQVDSHRKRPWYERLILKIVQVIPVGRVIDTDKTLSKLEHTIKKYDYKTSLFVGDYLGRYREKEIMSADIFGKAKMHDFENIQVYVPEKGDKFLKNLYGDYMKLPPEDERVAHGIKIIRMRDE